MLVVGPVGFAKSGLLKAPGKERRRVRGVKSVLIRMVDADQFVKPPSFVKATEPRQDSHENE